MCAPGGGVLSLNSGPHLRGLGTVGPGRREIISNRKTKCGLGFPPSFLLPHLRRTALKSLYGSRDRVAYTWPVPLKRELQKTKTKTVRVAQKSSQMGGAAQPRTPSARASTRILARTWPCRRRRRRCAWRLSSCVGPCLGSRGRRSPHPATTMLKQVNMC